jgi:ubiquitin-protein ligase
MNKRLLKELRALYIQQSQKELLENDYLIQFDEENMNKVYALIKAPSDSVYKHKFLRMDFKIPENYPHSPPEVQFVNHDGVRIHPNMYENGKCCSTILNTWGDSKFEKWTSSMGIETILLTFHSFLDNHPYTYEPGGHDDPSYTVYVKHQSWSSCLLQYLQRETIPLFTEMIHNYLLMNIESIFTDLEDLKALYPIGLYYTKCFEIDNYTINFDRIIQRLQEMYNYIDYTENIIGCDEMMDFEQFCNMDYKCNICFDTSEQVDVLQLGCGHQFHCSCLTDHVESNSKLCPMCRTELTIEDNALLGDNVPVVAEWIRNPLTKRRVKVGSRTWNYLKETGVI